MAKEVIAENNRKKEQNYTLLELLPSLAEDKVKPTVKTEGRMRQILKFHGGGGQNKTKQQLHRQNGKSRNHAEMSIFQIINRQAKMSVSRGNFSKITEAKVNI